MAQSFSVNGKDYLPSSVLAASFGYTSDYIGKLAREEKIIGTQVGRQWFIEPSSLELYLHKAQFEKELHKDELRNKRKLERAVFSESSLPAQKVHKAKSSITALAQSVAVLLCGALLGSLAWVVYEEGIGADDVFYAARENASLISQGLFLEWNKDALFAFETNTHMAASSEGVEVKVSTPPKAPETFAVLPSVRYPSYFSGVNASGTVKAQASLPEFSDEVFVYQNEDGTLVVEPVFRSGASSSERFMVLPVKEKDT